MTRPTFVLPLLLAGAITGPASAQDAEPSLQQERERIGAELTESREQTGRDINEIRERPLDDSNRLDEGTRPLPGQPRGSGSTVRQPERPVAPATRSEPGRPLTTPQPGGAEQLPGTSGNGGAASGAGGAATGGPQGGGADR